MSASVQPSLYTSVSSVVSSVLPEHSHDHPILVTTAHARAISFPSPVSHDSVNDPDDDEPERDYTEGDDEIDIMADLSIWHPFPRN